MVTTDRDPLAGDARNNGKRYKHMLMTDRAKTLEL